MKPIRTFRDLDVYRMAFELAIEIHEISSRFPREETYSLTDQIRRASRSICSNIGEAWRKRRYMAAFVSKLSDAETEAAEVQVWLQFAERLQYIPEEEVSRLDAEYENILGKLVRMIDRPEKWLIRKK